MADQKVVTIHVPKVGSRRSLRLTPELVELLSAASEQLGKPTVHISAGDITLWVDQWSNRV